VKIAVSVLPSDYTCDGEDNSLPIEIGGVNTGMSRCLAIIANDPNTPGGGGFVYWLARENVKLSGPASSFALTSTIKYGASAPMDVTVTSEVLTSIMQATNNANGPLKNMQVRLGNKNAMESLPMQISRSSATR